ncbi:MAG: cytochrome d ubiquinol oxidase subunit II [Chlamydiales bacterium]|nr:cytochrome d ubiquinol oxidase subunit II [Chlamydiales bacterium]
MFSLEVLQYIIYFVFIGAVIAYATLDGFDLGVGSLHLFARTDQERRLMLNAIGPVWDGNATWIVIGGGVLFAGFPKIFSTIMPPLYTPVMLLIFAFMLRGAAVEFRSKQKAPGWRRAWDFCFFFASILLALVFGLMIGNLIDGLPLDAQGNIVGGTFGLVRPYPVLVMLFALSLFMMHGSVYLLMKTEGAFYNRIRVWVKRLIVIFLVFWAAVTAATFVYVPHMTKPIIERPLLGIFALLSFASICAIPHFVKKRFDGWAFIASCLSICLLLTLFVIGTFPYIVYSTIDPAVNSLTLFNGSASKLALTVLTIVALAGFPLTFFYFSYLYRVFHGKVRLDHMSY